MKTSFAESAQVETPAPVAETEVVESNAGPAAALAPRPSNEVVPDSYFSNEGMEGDFDESDVKIPKLHVVQAVGPLSEHFQPGHWIFNKEADLGLVPIEITLIKLRKYFVEDLPYGTEEMPQLFDRMNDALGQGFLPVKQKYSMSEEQLKGCKFFKPVLECTVLIKSPKDEPSFPYEKDGAQYAFALWTLQGSAYNDTGTKFITQGGTSLKNDLRAMSWTVTPTRVKKGKNFIWSPVARMAKKHTADFLNWLTEIRS